MRFSVASGTDNSLLQTIDDQLGVIVLSNADIELHTHEIDNNTRPYGVEGLAPIRLNYTQDARAPHALTSRGSYTVPSNKIARVDLIQVMLVRNDAGSVIGVVEVIYEYTPSGGSTLNMFNVMLRNNTSGANIIIAESPKIIMEVGDELEILTVDGTTGGFMRYRVNTHISEIDA